MQKHNSQTEISSRRAFLSGSGVGLGGLALTSLLEPRLFATSPDTDSNVGGASAGLPHFAPRAKRVIYLFMHGGPSQMDLFDHKPAIKGKRGTQLPDSVRQGQRLTGMTSGQKNGLPVAPTVFNFARYGQSGAWVSEIMPHFSGVVDDVCFIKSMHTEAINHDPGVSMLQTGNQQPGRPSFGAWLSYGLGSGNSELPGFVVLLSNGSAVI